MNRMLLSLVSIVAVSGIVAVEGTQPQNRQDFVPSAEVRALLAPYQDDRTRTLLAQSVASRSGELENALRWLIRARIPDLVPESLVRGLRADFEVLGSPKAPLNLKNVAADDLILKGSFCQRSPDGLGAAVPVSVKTLLKDAEQKNWEVVYKTAVEASSDRIPPTPFPGLSSPSSKLFTAGRFVIWARDPNQHARAGAPRELVVDGNEAKLAFEVFVAESK